jgi:RimJ/RimL family protein N-acetyltransferase
MAILTTDRLVLRRWRESDREPFARMNGDPRVMEFMPGVVSREVSDGWVDGIERHFDEHGFGLCAAELRWELPSKPGTELGTNDSFIGFVGLSVPGFRAHFTPCIEIGWRLREDCWGRGLATEGARAIVRYAFDILRVEELVSFTVPANVRSRRVMEKIGMTCDARDDFDHPNLTEGHLLRRHVLYRLRGLGGGGKGFFSLGNRV